MELSVSKAAIRLASRLLFNPFAPRPAIDTLLKRDPDTFETRHNSHRRYLLSLHSWCVTRNRIKKKKKNNNNNNNNNKNKKTATDSVFLMPIVRADTPTSFYQNIIEFQMEKQEIHK
jgi:hypothetical protein